MKFCVYPRRVELVGEWEFIYEKTYGDPLIEPEQLADTQFYTHPFQRALAEVGLGILAPWLTVNGRCHSVLYIPQASLSLLYEEGAALLGDEDELNRLKSALTGPDDMERRKEDFDK